MTARGRSPSAPTVAGRDAAPVQEAAMKWIFSVLLVMLALAGRPASAQWSKRLDPAVPRAGDGKLDLSARPPRALDGKLDLSGVWLPLPDPTGKPQNVENIIPPRHFI